MFSRYKRKKLIIDFIDSVYLTKDVNYIAKYGEKMVDMLCKIKDFNLLMSTCNHLLACDLKFNNKPM